ncbi:MAG: hypothetical protein JNK29_06040 [Anaerolineales bacterium]|nr:hypothetical protein [Anaerolineales bacterium]
MNAAPPPASTGSGRQLAKIAGLVVLGVVVLCGVAGTCLLVLSFFLPQ